LPWGGTDFSMRNTTDVAIAAIGSMIYGRRDAWHEARQPRMDRSSQQILVTGRFILPEQQKKLRQQLVADRSVARGRNSIIELC
jgi:hypothetical protein